MSEHRLDILQGTLDMLILKALEGSKLHGYQIARAIEERAGDVVQVPEGSLYPCLHRMHQRGWLRSSWGRSENGRRARFYVLTAKGRRQLQTATGDWFRYVSAVGNVMTDVS